MLRKDFNAISSGHDGSTEQICKLLDKAVGLIADKKNTLNLLSNRGVTGKLGELVVDLVKSSDLHFNADTDDVLAEVRQRIIDTGAVSAADKRFITGYLRLADRLIEDVTDIESEHADFIAETFKSFEAERALRYSKGGFVSPAPKGIERAPSKSPSPPAPPSYSESMDISRPAKTVAANNGVGCQVVNIQIGATGQVVTVPGLGAPVIAATAPAKPAGPTAAQIAAKKQADALAQLKSQQETLAAFALAEKEAKAAQEAAMEVEYGSLVDTQRLKWEKERTGMINQAKTLYKRFEDEVFTAIAAQFSARNALEITIQANRIPLSTAVELRKVTQVPHDYSSGRAAFISSAEGQKVWRESYGPTLNQILKEAVTYGISAAEYALEPQYMPETAKTLPFTAGAGVWGNTPQPSFNGGMAIAPNAAVATPVLAKPEPAKVEPTKLEPIKQDTVVPNTPFSNKRYRSVLHLVSDGDLLRAGVRATRSFYPDTTTNFGFTSKHTRLNRNQYVLSFAEFGNPERDAKGAYYRFGNGSRMRTRFAPVDTGNYGRFLWATKTGHKMETPPDGPDGYDDLGAYWVYDTADGSVRVTHEGPVTYMQDPVDPNNPYASEVWRLRWRSDKGHLAKYPSDHPARVHEYETLEEIPEEAMQIN